MRLLLALLLSLSSTAICTTYYVDSISGDDSARGTTTAAPWKTLNRVNGFAFRPNDRILFRAGRTWDGQLAPRTSGASGQPIIIDRYAEGAKPKIDGRGVVEDAVRIHNVQNIEIRNLEITNHGANPAVRRGLHIFIDNFGTAHHIVVSGCYIHDVNGINGNGDSAKDNGGIIFRTVGDRLPSRFDGLILERNLIRTVDRSAIAADSYHAMRTRWFPSLHVIIRDNYVDDIGGDGIVPWATDGALVEHNIARNCNGRAGSYNAGIWPWSTDNSLFQLNEAFNTRTTLDGEGFDSDYNSRNTLFQYNYSHDNEGGFMLICTPGKRNPQENVGNTGTIVRYNISRNDKARAFHISGGDHISIHDNVVYVGPSLDIQMLALTNWSGWAADVVFRHNTFWVQGKATYGHEAKRNKDGTFELAPGWGPAQSIVFDENRYIGLNVNRPSDARGTTINGSTPPQWDWNGPAFDPEHLDNFDRFMAAHRKWLERLFEQQFGRTIQLGRQ